MVILSKRARALAQLAPLLGLLGCQSIDRFDTKGGGAYCGAIVTGQFVRTPEQEGGFQRNLRLSVQIDTDTLTTIPARITSDDAKDGPCMPQATFADAPVRVTPELVNDSLSLMLFEDGQVHNVMGWVDSACRGTMLAVVSLYKNDRVEIRFLRPADAAPGTKDRDAFSLFVLDRYDKPCGY